MNATHRHTKKIFPCARREWRLPFVLLQSRLMMVPVTFLAKKCKTIYKRMEEDSREVDTREERRHALNWWQFSCENEFKGLRSTVE